MANGVLQSQANVPSQAEKLPLHVVMLTNFIAPHKLPMYKELSKRVAKFTMLLSTPMEPNRRWETDWDELDVRLLRTSTIHTKWRHPTGFTDPNYIHIPWNTVRVLKQLQPDVIITCELGLRSALSVVHNKLVKRTPLILFAGISEHTEIGRNIVRRGLRRWLIRNADCIAVNGNSGGRYLESLGADPDRIRRIHYPTLPGVFDKIPIERDDSQAHRLLFVGQLIERKGVVPFTQALARWASRHPERRVEFTLAGYGPQQETLDSLPRPDNLALNVLGQCSYERIAECYASAGIFVFPTFADDWGMAVNEAMVAGLPVLGSTYSQAVEEMCVADQTGWPFQTDDVAGMERAIDASMNTSVENLREMRSAARARVQQMTPDLAADDWVDAIHRATRQEGNANRTNG
jgi:hypothetical protein